VGRHESKLSIIMLFPESSSPGEDNSKAFYHSTLFESFPTDRENIYCNKISPSAEIRYIIRGLIFSFFL